jgi:hypothetical protein
VQESARELAVALTSRWVGRFTPTECCAWLAGAVPGLEVSAKSLRKLIFGSGQREHCGVDAESRLAAVKAYIQGKDSLP